MIKYTTIFVIAFSSLFVSCAQEQRGNSIAPANGDRNRLAGWLEKRGQVLGNYIDAYGVNSIELENEQHQVLRFKMYHYKIAALHHNIAFQLFTYKDGYLQKIETFDSNGYYAGEHESFSEAITTFTIEKPDLYLQKKKLIDKAEGNIDLKDEKEKIIRIQLYDADGRQITIPQSNYISSSDYERYSSRLYWP